MSKLYVDPLLTNIAKGYRPLGHVNEIILPTLGVQKASAKIAVYGAENLRLVTTIKSAEGETPTVTMNPTTATAYQLEEHAIKAMASDAAAENQDKPFDEQRDKAELVTDLLSVGREIALATYMSDTTNITNNTTLSSTAQFGDTADDPIGVIDTAVQTVADAMGILDSQVSLVLSLPVWRVLVRLPEVLDTLGFKYHQASQVTEQDLARAFGVRRVVTAAGIYNSAEDGQTDVISRIWGKHMWAVYIPEQPRLKEHAFGYTCRRKAAMVVDKWYDQDRKGWWVRNTDEFDQYILNAKGAYLVKNAVA